MVCQRIERHKAYVAVSPDARRSAYDKVMKRLEEKEEEAEKDRMKRRERRSVDRPTHRDRERSERSHRGANDRHGRPSRSPEPDAYEADRRKAIADREKNYRKSNVADTLLSPARRPERERDIRDIRDIRDRDIRDIRDIDRPHRSRRDDYYDRGDRADRGDRRESEREKLYRRRGDPRGSIDELPWGDDRPATSRRRREDSIDSATSGPAAKVRHFSFSAPKLANVKTETQT